MTGESADELRGIEMSREEIDTLLTERGYGTLSLADAGHAYAVPVSVGYDGESLSLNLITFGTGSRKLDYLEATAEACVVVTDVVDRFDWRSAVVSGPTRAVPAEESSAHEAVMDDNGWFPSIFPPTDAVTDVTRVTLEPRELTGRKGEAHQPD